MRLGLIDLGTNSVRLDIYEIFNSATVTRLHREKLMIRLGDGVFATGKLDDEAVARTVAAFENFKQTAVVFKVTKIIAIGTSAMREAKDSARVVREIKERTGIVIEIISGTQEARLIADGVLKNESNLPNTFALVDIGGGSTEISLCKNQQLIDALSFDLGVARLKQLFLSSKTGASERPTKRQLKTLRSHVKTTLALHADNRKDWGKVTTIFGSSGTIRALARLIKKNGNKSAIGFDRESLRKLVKSMSGLTTSELLALPGMEERRVDLIVPGGILLDEVMEFIGAKRVEVTEFSLRDGLLLSEINSTTMKRASDSGLSTDDLCEIATRLGIARKKFYETANILHTLFISLATLHNLGSRWELYILAARLFSIIGQNINGANPGYYAQHLALHVDLPYLKSEERRVISELCEISNAHSLKKKKRSSLFESQDAELVKGLAILQLIAALQEDRGFDVELPQISITKKNILISIAQEQAFHLKTLRLEKRRDIIEQIFGRTVRLQSA